MYQNKIEYYLAYGQEYRDENKEVLKIRDKKYRTNNKEKCAYRAKRYYENNKDSCLARVQRWAEKNIDKANNNKKRWSKNNPEKVKEVTLRGRIRRKECQPKWLTADHKKEIKTIHNLAKTLTIETGVPHEVDHIIPVQGENVCGLTVPWNLRVVTRKENKKKVNKLIPELLKD